MEKWEYKTINIGTKGLGEGIPDISNFNMVINQLGNVGWELVSCFTTNQEQGCAREIIAVLKRKTNSNLTDLGDQSSSIKGRTHGHTEKGTRTNGAGSRTYRKSTGYAESRADHPGKRPKYSEKSHGYQGKSSGYATEYPAKSSRYAEKSVGYKGKNSGNARKGSNR